MTQDFKTVIYYCLHRAMVLLLIVVKMSFAEVFICTFIYPPEKPLFRAHQFRSELSHEPLPASSYQCRFHRQDSRLSVLGL